MSNFAVTQVRLKRGGRKPQEKQSAGIHGHGNGWKNVKARSMMPANRANPNVRGRSLAGGK
jgi:hypothetical protein